MEQEIDFEFTPEQIDAIQHVVNDVVNAMEKLWDAILEIVRATVEAIRKAFEPLIRRLAMLRLLEWRLPYRIANFISQKIPAWLAYDFGLRWFYARRQALT